MATQPPDWRELAKEAYRDAQDGLLNRWPAGSGDDMIDFFREELREALLDMKQAMIDDRSADAMASVQEAWMYIAELKRLTGEDQ